MTYKVYFSDHDLKQIKKLDPEVQERMLCVLERILYRPHHFVRKLAGRLGYRLRVGDYRLLLEIDDKEFAIHVNELGYRSSVYR
jgi:mRNA interferase RelE/StbE